MRNRQLHNQRIFNRFRPYLLLGMSVVFAVVLIVLLSYLFIWGAIIGAVFYLFTLVKRYFSQQKIDQPPVESGRVFEHDP